MMEEGRAKLNLKPYISLTRRHLRGDMKVQKKLHAASRAMARRVVSKLITRTLETRSVLDQQV